MKVLVTGGGGFLGRYVVEQLQQRGDTVRIFARGQYSDLASQGVEVCRGDLADAEAVSRAVDGVDAVIHTAAMPGIWGSFASFFRTNTLGTRHVIAACRRHGVPRLVHTSSPSVVFDGAEHHGADERLPYARRFLSFYPQTKAWAERDVLAANGDNLATVALRPHLIWGPRDNHLIPRLVQRSQAGRLVRVGSGQNRVSLSYVENAAHAHVLALDRLQPGSPIGGRAYFVNESTPVVLWEWIERLLADAGLPPIRRGISVKSAWRLGCLCEAVFRAGRCASEPPMTRFLALQLGGSHWYDISRAIRDLDYRPLVSAETGRERLLNELWGRGCGRRKSA